MPIEITNAAQSFKIGLATGFSRLMSSIPSLLGAIVILVAGWFISKVIGLAVARVLVFAKFDLAVEKSQIHSIMPRMRNGSAYQVSSFVGKLVTWFMFLIFVQSAVVTLGMSQMSTIINNIILFIPNVIVALALIVFGSWAARFCSNLVQNSTSQFALSSLVRYGILGFAIVAAMNQLGVATNLINILFTGLVASLSIAFGLAFGLGGRDAAKDVTQSLMSKRVVKKDKVNELVGSTSDLPPHH